MANADLTLINTVEITLEDVSNPVPIEIGLTMPGPVGPMGPPAPLYYGTTDPAPDLGEEGAIYIKYVG